MAECLSVRTHVYVCVYFAYGLHTDYSTGDIRTGIPGYQQPYYVAAAVASLAAASVYRSLQMEQAKSLPFQKSDLNFRHSEANDMTTGWRRK